MPRILLALSPEGAARQVSQHLARAFETVLGRNNLKIFDCLKYDTAFNTLLRQPDADMTVDLLNQQLVVQCLDFKADAIVVPALSPVTAFTLRLLQGQRIKTVHWFYEDFRRAGYWRDVVAHYDWFLAIQRGTIEQTCREAGTSFRYLPTASGLSISDLSAGQAENPERDVAFVGIPTPYRISVLERLASKNISMTIGGLGWRAYRGPLQPFVNSGEWIEGEHSAALLRSAKIGLHLSAEEPGKDRNETHVSPRVFDVLGLGLVLLTEEAPLITETLAGSHFHGFSSPVEVPGKVSTILADYKKERALAAANIVYIRDHHTYLRRAQTILSLLD
jgi:hypothetical protein